MRFILTTIFEEREQKGCKAQQGDEGCDAVAYREGEAEAFGDYADVADAHHGHEDGGQEGDDEQFAATRQPNGDGPEGDHAEALVDPPEIAPEDVEVDKHEEEGGEEEGGRHENALPDAALGHPEEVGGYEPCRTEGGVAGGDGCCHDAEDGEYGSDSAQPRVAYLIDDDSRIHLSCLGIRHRRE